MKELFEVNPFMILILILDTLAVRLILSLLIFQSFRSLLVKYLKVVIIVSGIAALTLSETSVWILVFLLSYWLRLTTLENFISKLMLFSLSCLELLFSLLLFKLKNLKLFIIAAIVSLLLTGIKSIIWDFLRAYEWLSTLLWKSKLRLFHSCIESCRKAFPHATSLLAHDHHWSVLFFLIREFFLASTCLLLKLGFSLHWNFTLISSLLQIWVF